MLRVIQEIQPTWVVAENVYGIVSWNEGMVFEQVHSDLEAAGYEVQAFVLPACGVGAPHRRYRVWFVAHATSGTGQQEEPHTVSKRKAQSSKERKDLLSQSGRHGLPGNAAHTNSTRLERSTDTREAARGRKRQVKQFARLCRGGYWRDWQTQSPVCRGDDGLPCELDGISISKWRRESIRMYGDAIVPQVAVQIFQAIQHVSKQTAATRC